MSVFQCLVICVSVMPEQPTTDTLLVMESHELKVHNVSGTILPQHDGQRVNVCGVAWTLTVFMFTIVLDSSDSWSATFDHQL